MLSDGTTIESRAVLIATGVRYNTLPLERWIDFEGAGIYYAATELEARACRTEPVTVVGGANSAGQAALYLASRGCQVTLAVRGSDVAATMSSYLLGRLRADPASRYESTPKSPACPVGRRWSESPSPTIPPVRSRNTYAPACSASSEHDRKPRGCATLPSTGRVSSAPTPSWIPKNSAPPGQRWGAHHCRLKPACPQYSPPETSACPP